MHTTHPTAPDPKDNTQLLIRSSRWAGYALRMLTRELVSTAKRIFSHQGNNRDPFARFPHTFLDFVTLYTNSKHSTWRSRISAKRHGPSLPQKLVLTANCTASYLRSHDNECCASTTHEWILSLRDLLPKGYKILCTWVRGPDRDRLTGKGTAWLRSGSPWSVTIEYARDANVRRRRHRQCDEPWECISNSSILWLLAGIVAHSAEPLEKKKGFPWPYCVGTNSKKPKNRLAYIYILDLREADEVDEDKVRPVGQRSGDMYSLKSLLHRLETETTSICTFVVKYVWAMLMQQLQTPKETRRHHRRATQIQKKICTRNPNLILPSPPYSYSL